MNEDKNNTEVISIKGLSKSFNGVSVLSGVNLCLHPAENLAVLGRSGMGKSVLLKCIVGLVYPDEGSISVFGNEITEAGETKLNEIRQNTGFVFQSAALYDSMTVKENLLFTIEHNHRTMPDETKEQLIDETLESVGLANVANKYPLELSGGMRKRAGLARTLVLKPRIILYDEPTTGLDPFTSREISELILEVKKKYQASAIIVTHDMTCARIASDRIMILHNGRFIAEDTFNNLKKSKTAEVMEYFVN